MIIYVTKTELTPGNFGKDCKGNGKHTRQDGSRIECCCDKCDYYLCCINNVPQEECENCEDTRCLRSGRRKFYHNIIDKIIRIVIRK